METEKSAIDLAVEQSHAVVGLAKAAWHLGLQGGCWSDILFKQPVEHSVAAQKKALDYYAEQHKTGCETAKQQFRIPSNPAAEPSKVALML